MTAAGKPSSQSTRRSPGPVPRTPVAPLHPGSVSTMVYQLQNYPGGRLDALAITPHQLAVIDLSRYASADYFRPSEIAALKASGKKVLAYFEIGSIENFRPEYPWVTGTAKDLVLNRWDSWPQEFFVKYWDPRWWDKAIKTRLDQALAAGFDGVYLDTPLAYEEIDLALVPGQTRQTLGRSMVNLIMKMSAYAKGVRPGFWIVPQNSPELREYSGYTQAIDGIGMEELFFLNTDVPCTQDYCAENLANTRALRDAGKFVLAVDYAKKPANIAAACARYKQERFIGYVTNLELDRISPPCP
jgi:cysteinyl-tRNA synthetase